MAHFSVKHRSPFRKSFIPSRRHKRQTASRCLAKALSPFLKLPNLFACYTRRRFGGRQPLCGTGVTSLIALMCKPEDAKARTADSRPAPGPFTRTSTDFIPYWSRATPAAVIAACCAAYGVPLREPLKPDEPAEAQLTTRPSGSVSVMIVLLNVAWIQTSPCGTIRFSFFLRNSFFRLAGFAPAAGAAAASLGSFAMSSCRTFQDAGLKTPALASDLTSKPDRNASGPTTDLSCPTCEPLFSSWPRQRP